jgi:integrase
MRANLTDIFIKNLKPPTAGSASVFDTNQRGLCLRVSAAGTKSFCLIQGKERRRTYIGKYPAVSLAEARSEVRRIESEQTLGITKPASTIRVREALDLFFEAKQRNKPRTLYDYRRLLNRHLNTLLTRSLDSITTRDLSRILSTLKATPSEQNHAQNAIAIFLRWCLRQGFVETNAAERLGPVNPTKSRDRVLSDSEVAALWRVAETQGSFGRIVQLCILIGQRRTEIASIQWEWIDDHAITFPASLMKNNRSHIIPIGDKTKSIIEAQACFSPFLFPAARGEKQFVAWSQHKKSFDAATRAAGYDVQPWTLHDLRRTFATNMASLGTPIHVTEKLLHHVSGTTSGIVAVYQRHSYMDEMRQATEAWEARLIALLSRS